MKSPAMIDADKRLKEEIKTVEAEVVVEDPNEPWCHNTMYRRLRTETVNKDFRSSPKVILRKKAERK